MKSMLKTVIVTMALSVAVATAPLSAATVEFEFKVGHYDALATIEETHLLNSDDLSVLPSADIGGILLDTGTTAYPSSDYGGGYPSDVGTLYAINGAVFNTPVYLPDITGI